MISDQAARDRVRADHGTSLFVEAGAGTGKTTALVDRVVDLVASGQGELRQLAAITFTEAAAAELRDRVRNALEQVVAGDDAGTSARSARDRCARALEQLDEAALTTLHGFAQRILTEHPFDIGLPPAFRVLDDIEAGVEFEQRWSALVDELFADPALEDALTTWLVAGISVNRLRPIALEFSERADRLPPAVPIPPMPPPDATPLVEALDTLGRRRRDGCRHDDDLLARHIDAACALREHLMAAEDPVDVLELLEAVPTLSCRRGRQSWWDDVDAVREACDAAEAVRRRVVEGRRQAALTLLAARVADFARDYADERRREGRLRFHDLLVLARDLLRDHPVARAATAARYRFLLLDEFQDTDPLQIELAVLLAARDDHDPRRPWGEARLRPGSLTVVGDPKQSIYRFRDADLRVYHEARERLGLERVALTENFRSVPGVLEVVNGVFGDVLVEEPGVQAGHVALAAHRADPGGTRIAVLGDSVDQPLPQVREDEAGEVAASVARIVREAWPVHDPDGSVRPATFRDVALLIPSRTVLPGLEAALDRAGIPVRVESQSLVFSTGEVRDLLSILTAIDDPTDEIAVVTTLRTAAFGCSDADLVGHVRAGGGWDYRRDAPEGGPAAVAEALAALYAFWRDRWWQTVSGTVEAVIRERHLFELAVRDRRPRDRWRRLRYLLDQARAWEDAGETSLRRFVEWAQRQADERARVNEAVAPEPDDPALRILTVHGAKGLEFPIVIMAGLNTLAANRNPPVLWTAGGPELRVVAAGSVAETAGYTDARRVETRHEEAERLRLLYVAMTRARDHLIVSLHRKGTRPCHAELLAAPLARSSPERLEPGRAAAPRHPAPAPAPASASAAARAEWISARGALLRRAGRPDSVAATTLAGYADGKAGDEAEPRPPWQRGRAGTAIGRAVHAVLQSVDLASGTGLAATARAQALAEGVAAREVEVRNLVASVLAAPTIRSAMAAGWRTWREVPVAAEIDGVLVEGFVDLLLHRPDGLVVVDYKTDQVPGDADLDAAVARYSPQAATYAAALEAVLHERVVAGVFIFARMPTAIERTIDSLPDAVAALRGRLARFSAA